MPTPAERAQRLLQLTARAQSMGLPSLSDAEFLHLLDEHRWAVGALTQAHLGRRERAALNAAVLAAHGLLHRRRRTRKASLAEALRRVARPLLTAALVFGITGMAAAAVVLKDPMVAYSIVPREFLAEIHGQAWGSRGSLAADWGMTFFYWGNNLRACFLALGLGVLGGVPALAVLATNGALMGAVAAVAVLRDAQDRLLGWLGPHGVPELLALLLCGAVGMELGWSWLVPGWRTRRAALAAAGHALAPLVVVAALLVICAAPLEGFVAPMELPPAMDAGIALAWVLTLFTTTLVVLR